MRQNRIRKHCFERFLIRGHRLFRAFRLPPTWLDEAFLQKANIWPVKYIKFPGGLDVFSL